MRISFYHHFPTTTFLPSLPTITYCTSAFLSALSTEEIRYYIIITTTQALRYKIARACPHGPRGFAELEALLEFRTSAILRSGQLVFELQFKKVGNDGNRVVPPYFFEVLSILAVLAVYSGLNQH